MTYLGVVIVAGLIRTTFLDTRVSFILFVSGEFDIYINENWNARSQICKKFSSGSLDTILYIFIGEKIIDKCHRQDF